MKKLTTLLGIIGAVLTTLGTIFKLFHWPYASILITIGATALAVYMWFYIFVQGKVVKDVIEKSLAAVMGLAGVFMSMGYVFKMQRWPGANILITIFIFLFILLIILSIIRVLREKDEDLQDKYTQTFIWLLGVGTMILYPIIQNLLT